MPKSTKKTVKRKLEQPAPVKVVAVAGDSLPGAAGEANCEPTHDTQPIEGGDSPPARVEGEEEGGEVKENDAGPAGYTTKGIASNNDGKGHEGEARDTWVDCQIRDSAQSACHARLLAYIPVYIVAYTRIYTSILHICPYTDTQVDRPPNRIYSVTQDTLYTRYVPPTALQCV